MVCRCNKCVEREEEIERISAIRKLTPDEIHVLNKDKSRTAATSCYIGFMIGVIGTSAIILEWVVLFA